MSAVGEEPRVCPGCRLALPADGWPLDRRVNASPECWHRYTAILGHEAEHVALLGRLHQLTVDAYAAQHAGDPSPPISTAFALIGLHLALDEGWSGSAVRAAHQFLAARNPTWPLFGAPEGSDWLTVADVALARNPVAHAERVERWAASVWNAWQPSHAAIRGWAERVLPASARGRLRAL